MRQIIYMSTSVGRQDDALLDAILTASRKRNDRVGITGLLVSGGLRFLQVIEGPALELEVLMERIRADDRHQSITVLVDRPVDARAFTGWSMAHFAEPKLRDFATLSEIIALISEGLDDARLLGQLDEFAQTFTIGPVSLRPNNWTRPSGYIDPSAFDSRH